jgi:thiol-disulfide isomerase/thioredoxin
MPAMNRPILRLLLLLWLTAALPLFGLELGEKAPPFANPDLASRHVLSRDYLGRGWLIVDFFATDCEGCKKELPVLERLQRELGPRLPILVFATDPAGQPVVEAYFRATPTPLTVLLDRYHSAVKRYGVSEIPSLFLIDPAGVVVLKQVGFQEELYERICALLPAGD